MTERRGEWCGVLRKTSCTRNLMMPSMAPMADLDACWLSLRDGEVFSLAAGAVQAPGGRRRQRWKSCGGS